MTAPRKRAPKRNRRRGYEPTSGPIEIELRAKQHLDLRSLTSQYSRQRLSLPARRVLRDAHTELTGMLCSVNEYWLAETLSEAIEAAEALKL